MKIKILILSAFLLTFVCVGSAQTKKTVAAAGTPDAVVKNLYAAHDGGKSPFFQTKNRALLDKFFVKELADMIWKDAVDSEKEQGVGAIDFDPLYDAQDTEITKFVIGKPQNAGGDDNSFVRVTFKNYDKSVWIDFELVREAAGKDWKISGISYGSGDDIASILRYSQDEEFRKEFDENQIFIGEYMVGDVICNVLPTLNGISHRIQCGDSEDYKLYQVEGDEVQTSFIHVDEKGVEKGKFVFKNGEKNGTFTDASGKTVKVSKVE